VNRLRNRLILIFLAATLLPLLATLWITSAGSQYLLDFSTTGELGALSQSLEQTGRKYYQRTMDDLKQRAARGDPPTAEYRAAARHQWPVEVESFAAGVESDRFVRGGAQGDRLDYLVRQGDGVRVYSDDLGVPMDRLSRQIGDARRLVEDARERDLRRGFRVTYILLAASFWVMSLALLVFLAHHVSRPIRQLTEGLSRLAAGDLNARVPPGRDDEVGRAIQAFNDMATRLKQSTDRLIYLGQMASWQTLARKMAHEVKNSLTPIRLTVEEMLARYREADRGFMAQATDIVVDEIETLERRVRAFSEFAAEPPVQPCEVDINSLVEERVALLKSAHPEVAYDCRLASSVPHVVVDQDLLKGILTNLFENAAEAAGAGGHILGVTAAEDGRVSIEVHDSGPGLSDQARASLFQPTISFKKHGMGLGLSIARKSALLSGGDIVAVKGELGGAGFRVLLPLETNGVQTLADRR
jgi:nitrogen fixation/metabolism regulation signal transduction histidine kinase